MTDPRSPRRPQAPGADLRAPKTVAEAVNEGLMALVHERLSTAGRRRRRPDAEQRVARIEAPIQDLTKNRRA